ncbi:MAG TPA: DUF5522 domain-containing protein [Terracidiphilus sp.]|nr:DUF5522 domain-containing protein [Terracidiphilus sp.]
MDDNPPASPLPLSPEDYYMEGPYMVFTAAYHLKRGYCCGSGCRHCPYREDIANRKKAGSAEESR